MKRQVILITSAVMILCSIRTAAQNSEVQTVFKRGIRSSGGYGAISNKLTTIRGDFANISGIYGGWYLNHKFLVGLEASAVTNDIRVPQQYSLDPNRTLSYGYGQFGLHTEYVVNSNKPVHLALTLFAGPGFTLQYDRHALDDHLYGLDDRRANWFFVAEPGVQVEVNLFKWMRFSPGVSYRASFGSDAPGMSDKDVSNVSYNATLKFGKF
jgi:hypothetical protein